MVTDIVELDEDILGEIAGGLGSTLDPDGCRGR